MDLTAESGEGEMGRHSTWMAVPWPDLADGIGFDVPGHHRAQEVYGEQEKLEASSMDGSGEAATARWRRRVRLGGLKLTAAWLRA